MAPRFALEAGEVPFHLTGGLELCKGFEAIGNEGEMRIAGIVSSESRDADGEVMLQNGLVWDYFMKAGWFNDSHDQGAGGGVGIPKKIETIRLPSGTLATRCEGVLLDTPDGRRIWNLAKAATKVGRQLGFSIEGGIARRAGADGKTVMKAYVRDCAITRHPKNPDTATLEPLIKAFRTGDLEAFAKSMTAGYGGPAGAGGSGSALVPQSLDGSETARADFDLDVLNDAEAVGHIMYTLDVNKTRATAIYREIRGF